MGDEALTKSSLVLYNLEVIKQPLGGLLSDELRFICQWILFAIVCQAICAFGIATNIINIICFTKQGFTDPINTSLLGLSIADLCCLITLVWANICYTPTFIAQDLPFDTIECQYLTGGTPHTTFTRITGCITAVITMERCLCVTIPLKVKEIFTTRRVAVIIICIFLINMSTVVPVYVVNTLGMKYFPELNKTQLGLIYGHNHEHVESVSYTINNVVVPGFAFLMIIVCTIILVLNLHKGTRWNKTSMINEQADKVSRRNKKIAKMVLLISTTFICCFIPVSVIFLAMSLEPEFSLKGRYTNILTVIAGFGLILESVNSSANILIYYLMSSKYKEICDRLFYANPTKCCKCKYM